MFRPAEIVLPLQTYADLFPADLDWKGGELRTPFGELALTRGKVEAIPMIGATNLVAVERARLKVGRFIRTFANESEVSAIHSREQKPTTPELDGLHLAWKQILNAQDRH